jgi:hypothetical protein
VGNNVTLATACKRTLLRTCAIIPQA